MEKQGILFIVSGPAGSGKGTVVSELRKIMPDVGVSVSATTRAPRPGEVCGVRGRSRLVEDHFYPGRLGR